MMRRQTSVDDLINGTRSGNRLALARAISHVEDGGPFAQSILRAIFPYTGNAYLIGITGAPGTGKSTLVAELAKGYRAEGMRVAVLAVDPTSPFTGGALLGDRVRMAKLSGDAGVFIRSMATRGHLGGLAAATADVLLLLDAAGFERVIVETVGVGQAEVEIAGTAHTTVVVEAPGLGDEVQAIKAGVLEIADVFAVNKADRPGIERTVAALELTLQQQQSTARSLQHHGQWMVVESPISRNTDTAWTIPVLKSIATTGGGVPELQQEIENHRMWLMESGEMQVREQRRMVHLLEKLVQTEVQRRLRTFVPDRMIADLVVAVSQRTVDPYAAAEQILANLS